MRQSMAFLAIVLLAGLATPGLAALLGHQVAARFALTMT